MTMMHDTRRRADIVMLRVILILLIHSTIIMTLTQPQSYNFKIHIVFNFSFLFSHCFDIYKIHILKGK